MRVVKTKRRTVASVVYGMFEAREVNQRCENDSCPPVVSDELRKLVPRGQRYAYDLIVDVGLARHLAGEQRDEIRRRLVEKHGIALSAGTVSTLCDRFLSYFERLHISRAAELRRAQQGGYPLHIDATCEAGRGGMFVSLDGWRGWVLWAGRIPSESTEHLSPFVEQTVALFGKPLAVVRDMGEGMTGRGWSTTSFVALSVANQSDRSRVSKTSREDGSQDPPPERQAAGRRRQRDG